MRGRRNYSGCMKWIGRIADEDALVLRMLDKAAAVFYVRINQPQTLMHTEYESTIYDTTVNPFNRNLSSDGSSGGEGTVYWEWEPTLWRYTCYSCE